MTDLIKSRYPCCNSSSRFDDPQEGQTLERTCKACKRHFTVRLVRAALADRWGIDLLKAEWVGETR